MKQKSIFLILLVSLSGSSIAQESFSFVKNRYETFYGGQLSLLGIWAYHESGKGAMALRKEVGFNANLFGGANNGKTGYIMTPAIKLEPRIYYNKNYRAKREKRTENNSADFLAIELVFSPDWFSISNFNGYEVIPQLLVLPKWGIRRVFDKHNNVEFGLGLGVAYDFAKSKGYIENEMYAQLGLHLRYGFDWMPKRQSSTGSD